MNDSKIVFEKEPDRFVREGAVCILLTADGAYLACELFTMTDDEQFFRGTVERCPIGRFLRSGCCLHKPFSLYCCVVYGVLFYSIPVSFICQTGDVDLQKMRGIISG